MPKSISQFEELFKSNHGKLCGISNRIIRDKDAAQDIVQEVFIKLWNRQEELVAIANISGYLFRATANASINYLESSKKMVRLDEVHTTLSVNADEAITISELEAKIQRALDKLPPKCKAIFTLSRFEGMKYKEIADHLDISIKTVENQMGIALEKMRNDLKPYLTKEFLALAVSAGITFLIHFLSLYLIIFLSYHLF